MEQMGYNSVIQQDYDKITKREEVTEISQITITNLCDSTRKLITGNCDNYTRDINAPTC
jgi:hypothetical protein